MQIFSFMQLVAFIHFIVWSRVRVVSKHLFDYASQRGEGDRNDRNAAKGVE